MKKTSVLLLPALILGLSACGGEPAQQAGDDTQAPAEQAQAQTAINYDNFLAINMGDPLEAVNELLGQEGVESSDYSGLKTYVWEESAFEYIDCGVQNGAVMSKTQIGLKDVTVDLTLDMYNQIAEGMTYEQVADIIGADGALFTQNKIAGVDTIDYHWNGEEFGQLINVATQNGTVVSKSQNDLS